MNKSAKTVTVLHSITFTLFFIINIVMNSFVYPKMADSVTTFWAIFIETVISAFLYSVLYFIVKTVYKIFVFKIKDKTADLSGTWYHVMIKRDLHGFVHTQKLRAGVTKVKQDLYDLHFNGDNSYFSLDGDGNLIEDSRPTNQTHWWFKTAQWHGESQITACYHAGSGNKKSISSCPFCGTPFPNGAAITVEKKDRIGIHNLEVLDRNRIKGTFADEYPSASYGEIFFYRNREDRDKVIIDFLQDGDIDNPI